MAGNPGGNPTGYAEKRDSSTMTNRKTTFKHRLERADQDEDSGVETTAIGAEMSENVLKDRGDPDWRKALRSDGDISTTTDRGSTAEGPYGRDDGDEDSEAETTKNGAETSENDSKY